ncbi:MAG: copper chaperone PCu(A)C [Alphaproteobacteria bacterium]|nr:copper chaperone PCu(A)C [Alphaproteobacteria bacterium]
MNRRRLILAPLALFLTLLAAQRTWAHSFALGTIEIGHPWAEPAVGDVAVLFMALANMGDKSDRLVGASTPIADAAVFENYGDHPVDHFELQPKRPVALRPGGRHIALRGLKRRLAVGDSFPLTLRFAAAGSTTVTVLVERGPEAPVQSPSR